MNMDTIKLNSIDKSMVHNTFAMSIIDIVVYFVILGENESGRYHNIRK